MKLLYITSADTFVMEDTSEGWRLAKGTEDEEYMGHFISPYEALEELRSKLKGRVAITV